MKHSKHVFYKQITLFENHTDKTHGDIRNTFKMWIKAERNEDVS
jgi:hypothetical protein